jgi:hypothetical protein
MINFFVGLGIGLAVAYYVKYRADEYWTNTNIAIYEGYATPDEGGRLGWTRKPETGRFDGF